VTAGQWEVTQIAGFRADTRTAYYLSTQGDETERRLYSVNIDAGTPSITNLTDAGFYAVSFSTQSGFYLLTYNGPDIPYQNLKSTSDKSLLFRWSSSCWPGLIFLLLLP
jgi:dipeptidyl-peptidase-4